MVVLLASAPVPDFSLGELLVSPEAWIALLTLTLLEIVLGIDNIVFITIVASRLPEEQQLRARRLGLIAALLTRVLLLFAISWVVQLDKTTLFTLPLLDHGVTVKDLILILGGMFLLGKATIEVYNKVELKEFEEELEEETEERVTGKELPEPVEKVDPGLMRSILIQIMLLDIVFSLDSVITAVGMAKHVPVMVAAVMIAVGVMLAFAGPIGDFVEANPSIKILALSFLLMIGVLLVAEGTGAHMEKGYVYFGMGFALFIELLNMRYRKKKAKLIGPGGAKDQTGKP